MANPCDRCGELKGAVLLTMRTCHNTTQKYLCAKCLQALRNYWKLFITMGRAR